jgi:hypothetical protein
MYRGDYVDGNGIEVALTWWVRAESAGCALYWRWVGLGGGALGGGILAEPLFTQSSLVRLHIRGDDEVNDGKRYYVLYGKQPPKEPPVVCDVHDGGTNFIVGAK